MYKLWKYLDPRKLLGIPIVYRMFRHVIGRDSFRRDYAENHIRAKAGQRVLDIGCGTGDILEFLPAVVYVGFDMDADYINAARQRFGHRGTFFCDSVRESVNVPAASFDIVIAHGVLHHLDDGEAKALFKIARSALKPGGRLLTIDPCFSDNQTLLSRFLVSRDRGQHVRRWASYKTLAHVEFEHVSATVHHGLIRIPYTHLIMECTA